MSSTDRGWECPVCHACYAPHIARCVDCPPAKPLRERVSYPGIRFPKPDETPPEVVRNLVLQQQIKQRRADMGFHQRLNHRMHVDRSVLDRLATQD